MFPERTKPNITSLMCSKNGRQSSLLYINSLVQKLLQHAQSMEPLMANIYITSEEMLLSKISCMWMASMIWRSAWHQPCCNARIPMPHFKPRAAARWEWSEERERRQDRASLIDLFQKIANQSDISQKHYEMLNVAVWRGRYPQRARVWWIALLTFLTEHSALPWHFYSLHTKSKHDHSCYRRSTTNLPS